MPETNEDFKSDEEKRAAEEFEKAQEGKVKITDRRASSMMESRETADMPADSQILETPVNTQEGERGERTSLGSKLGEYLAERHKKLLEIGGWAATGGAVGFAATVFPRLNEDSFLRGLDPNGYSALATLGVAMGGMALMEMSKKFKAILEDKKHRQKFQAAKASRVQEKKGGING